MHIRKVVAGAVVLAVAGVIGLPAAGAVSGPPQPQISYVGGAIMGDGRTAVVRISYTCSSTETPLNHLFVAVKQGGSSENPFDPSWSSESGALTGFLSTNWKSDQGPNALRCDGKTHEQSIVVKFQPGTDGALHTGDVLVQLCIFDNVVNPESEDDPGGGFGMNYTIQHAVIAGGNR